MRSNTIAAEQRGFQTLDRAVFEAIEPRLLLSAAVLDQGFGRDGRLVVPMSGDNYIFATHLLSNGHVLMAGSSVDANGNSDVLLMCWGPADASGFDPSWTATVDLGSDADAASAIAVKQDGSIVLAGQTVRTGTSYDFAVMQFSDHGVLDASFGSGGIVLQDISGAMDVATAVVITSNQAGDWITVAGTAQGDGGMSIPAVMRLDSHGSIDTSFGDEGIAISNALGADTRVSALVARPDGSYVLGATSRNPVTDVSSFAAIGLNGDGSKNGGFGTDGITLMDFGQGGAILTGMALDSAGAVWMAGISGGDFAVARLTGSGFADTGFNGSGMLTIDFNGGDDGAMGITVAPDGTAYVGGFAMSQDGNTHFAVAGLSDKGTLDPTFGRTILDLGNSYERANAISLDASGFVLAGTSTGNDADPAAVRFAFPMEPQAQNTAPTVTMSGDTTGVRGQSRSFSATVSDAESDPMEIAWDFGDGQFTDFMAATATGALTPTHVFSAEGKYTVTVTVRDESGASSVATREIVVTQFALQADATNPKKMNLVVGGTAGNDTILFTRNCSWRQPGMKVKLNGKSYGPFNVTGRLIAFGQAGDDLISLVGPDWTPCEFRGDDGNDLLKGSLGKDTLDGGNGDDWIIPGWSKKDVIDAGPGKNHVGWFKWRPLVKSGILDNSW